MKKLLILLFAIQFAHAKSNTEKIGDFLAFAIPATSYASTWLGTYKGVQVSYNF